MNETVLGIGFSELVTTATSVAGRLVDRGQTVAVVEGSSGGLISAALLAVPGASRYFLGGGIVYTRAARRAILGDAVPVPPDLRGASEAFALYEARSGVALLGATWAIGEAGAAGPSGNGYGDPPGHDWVAVAGPVERTRHLLTHSDNRQANMVAFAGAALDLLSEALDAA